MRIHLFFAATVASLVFAGCDGGDAPPATPDGPPAGMDAMPTADGPVTPPPITMSFFITSTGHPNGGDFRRAGMNDVEGLLGADEFCRSLAAAANPALGTKPWRAYLSTSTVNAKDRIGAGPWYNQKLVKIADSVADLLDLAPPANGGKNKIDATTGLDEKGAVVPGSGHDILTGTIAAGTVAQTTCANWTSSAAGVTATVGHFDRQGGNSTSWSTAHASGGCAAASFPPTGGRGSIYCFVAN